MCNGRITSMLNIVLLFGRKRKNRATDGDAAENADDGVSGGKSKVPPGKSSEYLAQARAMLLEANISGASVREAQELFKKALKAHKAQNHDKAIEYAMECIEIVDDILKNE
jgi:hypothetical protein